MASNTKPLINYTDMLIPEAQKFFNFFSICHTGIDSKMSLNDIPETIYHYTSIYSLMEIVKGSNLFVTKYDYLNDISEVAYGIDLFKSLLLDKGYSPEINTKVNRMLDETRISFDNSYILCFSEEYDSLQMWKYYGQNDGYCIGVNTSEFIELFDGPNKFIPVEKNATTDSIINSRLSKVIYNYDLQKKMIMNIIDVINMIILDNQVQHLNMFTQLIANCTYFFKSQQFSNEKEIRFIISPQKGPTSDNFEKVYLHHRIKCGSFIPYLNVKMQPLPIEKIIIGPHANNDISEKGLKSYLKSLGWGNSAIEDTVEKSKIKLRY